MGKSLQDIYRQMQAQQEQRRQAQLIAEQQQRQRAEQQRREWLDRNRIFERALSPSAAASSSAAGAGGTPKRPEVIPSFLTFEYVSFGLYYLNQDGFTLAIETSPFTGITTFGNNPDDSDFIYYVTLDDTENITFGKMNKTTFVRTDLDTTILRGLTQLIPCSLLYTGSGQFLYLDNFNLSQSVSNLFRISADGQTVTQLSSISDVTSGAESLLLYDGQYYLGSSYLFSYASLYSLSIDDGLTEYLNTITMNPESLPNGIVNTKVWYIFDFKVAADGSIWALALFFDKDNFPNTYNSIGKLNLDTAVIDFKFTPTLDQGNIFLTSMAII